MTLGLTLGHTLLQQIPKAWSGSGHRNSRCHFMICFLSDCGSVYLQTSPHICHERLKRRCRAEEKVIPLVRIPPFRSAGPASGTEWTVSLCPPPPGLPGVRPPSARGLAHQASRRRPCACSCSCESPFTSDLSIYNWSSKTSQTKWLLCNCSSQVWEAANPSLRVSSQVIPADDDLQQMLQLYERNSHKILATAAP